MREIDVYIEIGKQIHKKNYSSASYLLRKVNNTSQLGKVARARKKVDKSCHLKRRNASTK